MIERILTVLMTIPTTIALLIVFLLSMWISLRPVTANESPAGDVAAAAEQGPQKSRLKAAASGKASASASSRTGSQGCRAESYSQAEATAGDDHDYHEDHDSAEQPSGNCRAEASSRAKVTTGHKRDE